MAVLSLSVWVEWLDMDDDVRPVAVARANAVLDALRDGMRIADGQLRIDTHMDFDGDSGADAAGAQIVGVPHGGILRDQAHQLGLRGGGERLFQQFPNSRRCKLPRRHRHENRNGDRGQRVEHDRARTERHGATDTDQRPDR